MAAVTSSAARAASPVFSGPAAKSMPIAIPCDGRNPANQYTTSPCAVLASSTTRITVTAPLVAIAAASRTARRPRSSGPSADTVAAASSGTTTERTGNWSTAAPAQPLSWASSCGSRVPNRLCAWIANASSSADTAASTTTSVRASAWTTGSTAGVWFGTSKK